MLITTCPHCETRFKVTTEQLLLRNGTVRCGACRQVFDGGARLVSDEAADLLLNPIAAVETELTSTASESMPATGKTERSLKLSLIGKFNLVKIYQSLILCSRNMKLILHL